MHILVTNDDGPPSNQSSPYIHSFVTTLQSAGHTVSVCLPHTQRSWIGKAHMVGQTIKPTYFRPGTLHKDDGVTYSRPLKTYTSSATPSTSEPSDSTTQEWVLINSTPAACVQMGLHHFPNPSTTEPISLVISGPNYGRNTTAVFALSSGTLGGALEAAVLGVRAIALSYAFQSRDHDPAIIAEASQHAVRVCEKLAAEWDERCQVYSVNVPLVKGVSERQVMWTEMLQNSWAGSGSCFEEMEVDEEEDVDAEEAEKEIREREGRVEEGGGSGTASREGERERRTFKHRHFRWAPKFKAVHDSVEKSGPGSDGWVVKEGYTSVTPIRANYMHVPGYSGEMKL